MCDVISTVLTAINAHVGGLPCISTVDEIQSRKELLNQIMLSEYLENSDGMMLISDESQIGLDSKNFTVTGQVAGEYKQFVLSVDQLSSKTSAVVKETVLQNYEMLLNNYSRFNNVDMEASSKSGFCRLLTATATDGAGLAFP